MIISSQHKGIFYTALSGILYGSLGYFGVCIMQQEHISPAAMLFWRFFIANFVFLILLGPSLKTMPFNFKDAFYVFTGGSLLYAGCAEFYFLATKFIGMGLATVLSYTYPVMVCFLNWLFYKQKPTMYDLVSFLCIIVGTFLLVNISSLTFDIYGILLALLGSFIYGLYVVFSAKQVRSLNPLLSSFFVSIGSSILFFLLAQGENTFFIPTLSITWFNILGIAIFSTALPMFLLLVGLQYIDSTKASIISTIDPIISVMIGIIAFKEALTFLQSIGIIIILSAVLIIQFDKK